MRDIKLSNNASTYISSLGSWMIPIILAIMLVVISFNNFLLFHTLAEFFTIIVAVVMCVVVWHTYVFSRNHFLMFLGCGYFWIAALDMVHSMAYKGMPTFAMVGGNTSTQLWIAARYFEALLLLTAPLFLTLPLVRIRIFAGFGVLASVLFSLIVSGNFPDSFIKGEGLTFFKISSEYIIIVIMVAAMTYLINKRHLLDNSVLRLMLAAISLTICAELSFTFYVSVYGLSNLTGHIFKFFSFWLIFVAVVRTTLTKPYLIMARGASTYDAVPEPTIVVEHDGIIHQVNRAACDALNLPEAELLDHQCHKLFHSQDTAIEDCLICQHIRNGEALTVTEIELPESNRWQEFTLSPIDTITGLKGMVQVSSDITERKRVESELEEHREHLEEKVKVRTAELEEKNKDLKQYNELFSEREFRIKVLRDRVKELEAEKP